MDIFLDMHQYRKISEAQNDATTARSKVDRFDHRLVELERRVNRLSLASQALWELLQERTDLTQEQVFHKMEEIDLRDGIKDGKISGKVMKCVACNRPVNTSNTRCIYCGTEIASRNIV